MMPLIRFHSVVLVITTLTMFYLWDLFLGISTNTRCYIPIAAISSIGFYRLFMLVIKFFVLKIRILKTWLFGAYYFEGVWVGFYIGKEGDVRYYIEIFEQDLDSFVIRGKGFREDDGYFSSWVSESVSFNAQKGMLSYTYQTDALTNSFINSGLANFVVERKKHDAAPYRLYGFSSDLYNPQKLKSFEEKIKDKPDVENVGIALNKAKALYVTHKYLHSLE